MSFYYNDDVFNNNVNDNKVNDKKSKSTYHQIKKLIKCLLKKNNKNTYVKNPQPNYYYEEDEISDNIANEILENEIFEDIDNCEDFAAVPVYEEGEMSFVSVSRGQRYIPVHFARTDAGTFFWTSISGPDADICSKNAISNYQVPQSQVPSDRWAQA